MSAVASLQGEIDALTQKLDEVSVERDMLQTRTEPNTPASPRINQSMTPVSPDPVQGGNPWEIQCQRYEERIVELHSVIAELTRKLDEQRDDVIREESEFEAESNLAEEEENNPSDSFNEDPAYEDEDEDYTSLAFERDLDRHPVINNESASSSSSSGVAQRDYETELQTLRQELMESQTEVERVHQELGHREQELADRDRLIDQLQIERDSYRRQVEDIKATVEYQEARMDNKERPSSSNGNYAAPARSSSERRSLRRKRHEKQHEAKVFLDKT